MDLPSVVRSRLLQSFGLIALSAAVGSNTVAAPLAPLPTATITEQQINGLGGDASSFWVFDTYDTNGSGTPPDPTLDLAAPPTLLPSYGDSAARLSTGPGTGGAGCSRLGGKSFLGTRSLQGTRLSELTALGFSHLVDATNGSAPAANLTPYVNIYVDRNGDGVWEPAQDSILIHEPFYTLGAPTLDVWYDNAAIGAGANGRWHYAGQALPGVGQFTPNTVDLWTEVIAQPVGGAGFDPAATTIGDLRIANPAPGCAGSAQGGTGVEGTGSGLVVAVGQKSGTPWDNFVAFVDAAYLTATGANAVSFVHNFNTCPATIVTNANDSGAGSLRQVIADACDGATITFDPVFFAMPRTITLTSGELAPARNMSIAGPGAALLTISGNNATRVLRSTNISLAVSGVTLTAGNSVAPVDSGFGGAVFQRGGTLTLADMVISASTCTITSGGLVSAFGTLSVSRLRFTGNTCHNISAIAMQDGTATVVDTTIDGNGGSEAIRVVGITANTSMTLTNVTITGNSSVNENSAIRSQPGVGRTVSITLNNSTISGNSTASATGNGAFWHEASGGTSVTLLRNSIIAGNTVNGVANDLEATVDPSSANNLIGAGGNLVNGVNGNLVGVNNPLLAPLANYGGTLPTRALLPGSPAINAGSNTGAPATDQRGIARPQQGTVDIGAFESRGFTLALSGGNNQSAGPGLVFANPLTATVTAIAAGEPVQGGQVTFTPPGAGASASLAPNPAPIGAGGVASTTATANTTVGTYSVAAAANGATPSLSYALTNAGADLSIDDVTITEGNAGFSNAVFTVARSNSLTAFSVPYSMTAGTAQAGSDYTPTSGTLTFAVGGALTQTISVPVVGDLIVETTENATLNLGAVTNTTGVTTITDGSGLLTINDNDSAVVAFNPVSVSQSEATSPMVFTVTLSNPVQSGVTLTLNSAFGSATAADFTAIVGGTVSFAANTNTSQTVNVVINNDALDENDEQFTLTLSALTAVGNVSLGANVATGTIVDDDLPPVLSITSPSQPEGNVGNTPMDFVVSLSAVSGRDVSFAYATVNGTATVADNDYLPLPLAVLTIPAGQTSLTIPVQIVGDTIFEGNESFILNLTGISNANPTSIFGTGTIEDDDQQATTTTISSTLPDPSVVGQPYTVVVDVAAVALSPLGTVSISDGSVSCGPVALVPGTAPNSSASCQLTSTTAGAKTLTATYTPASGAFTASDGSTTHQVNAASTAISVSGPPRSRINQPTTFTFALSVNAPGAGSPAGTVTLSSGASSCSVTVPTATPSCALTFDTLGPRTVSAAFAPSDGNFLASGSSGAGNALTLVFALSDMEVTKSNAGATYVPGELLVYTVTVRNLGPDAAANIRVRDQVPAGLLDVVWSCDASGGVVCPQEGGNGDLDATTGAFPVGGLLNYTFFGNAGSGPAPLVNTALVELPADTTIEDLLPGNNSATDTDLLEFLFKNGFEDPIVNSQAGSYLLPTLALRAVLDDVARVVFVLDDANGLALRVYARVFDNQVQYALAIRDSQGKLRLGAWHSLNGDPTLNWTARQAVSGWVLHDAELR